MIDENVFQTYLQALLKGDRNQCCRMAEEIVASKVEIKTIYTDLFQRSLYRVGELWETNRISVATEHMATAITDGLLSKECEHRGGNGGISTADDAR